MVLKCWYCGEATDKNTGRTFHQFPLNQPELLQSWLKNMDVDSNFIPTRSMKLCSDHFSNDCLRKAGVNVKLVDGSVPTLFGTYKASCIYCAIKRTHEDHRSFHKLPLRSPVLLEKWLKGMGKENYLPNEESLLCSDHFEQTCFRPSGKGNYLRLRSNAVPTIFAPIITEEMPVVTLKRKHDSLHESPVAKHSRLDTQCETAVQPMETCVLPGFLNDIQVVEQHTMHAAPCTAMTHLDVDSECRFTMNSSEKATDFPNATFSSEVSPPEVTTPPRRRRQPTTPRSAQHISYMTKHDHQYENSPKTMKTKLLLSSKKLKHVQEELRVHKQRIKRLHKKITTLKDIVSELRRSRALPESGLSCLHSIAEDDVSQFLKRYLKNQRNVQDTASPTKKRQWKCKRRKPGLGISKEKYPPALRSFAMTLHFYSPKAYGFARRKFCNALPDPATLRSWYSTINGEPGYTSESFDALKIKVSEAKNYSLIH